MLLFFRKRQTNNFQIDKDDKYYIDEINKNNPSVMGELYKYWMPKINVIVECRSVGEENYSEIFFDSYDKMALKISEGYPIDNFFGLFSTIIKNTCQEYTRQKISIDKAFVKYQTTVSYNSDNDDLIKQIFPHEFQKIDIIVQNALGNMEEPCKGILTLIGLGTKYKEIAKKLTTKNKVYTENAIKLKIYHCRKKLHDILSKSDYFIKANKKL